MDKIAAIEKAYEGGLLAAKTEIVIEGVYDRSTNWGRGMTVTVKGASVSQAEQAVRKFGFVSNFDERNRRPNGKNIYLTTFAEGMTLAQSLGILPKVKAVAQLIPACSRETIRLSDHSADILVAVCEAVLNEVAVEADERLAFEGILINAFEQGMLGLTLGSSDIEALTKGEGLLDRYSKGEDKQAA